MVADHTFVMVRKHGGSTKFRAQVEAVGHECDLAILVVDSEEFWEGVTFLELGDIPFLQQAVAVVGYPQGTSNVLQSFICLSSLIFCGSANYMCCAKCCVPWLQVVTTFR